MRLLPPHRKVPSPFLVLCFACLLCGCSCSSKKASSKGRDQPRIANVVLITLDTTRADHLTCYRQGRVPQVASAASTADEIGPGGVARTPQLDALADRGVRFVHATVQVPVTYSRNEPVACLVAPRSLKQILPLGPLLRSARSL